MCKTRVEAVDRRLMELGYPDAAYAMYHEALFVFARNFAGEADRQQAEIERLEAIVARWPVMADGVPIEPSVVDRDVWTWIHPQSRSARHPPAELIRLVVQQIRFIEYDTEFDGIDEYGEARTVDVEKCYSTREAAQAAGGE